MLKANINQHSTANIRKDKVNNLHWYVNTVGSAIVGHLQNKQQKKKQKKTAVCLVL